MKANIQAKRIDQTLQVIERMKEGRFIHEACRDVGIRTSTLETVCDQNPEIFDKIREVFAIQGQHVVELIIAHNNELLKELEAEELAYQTKKSSRLLANKKIV